MTAAVTPFSLKDAPALIERLLPVQKLSAEAYKEQMAGSGKTLTPLGSYWKGRKPLILNKACILGCLLPATDDQARDLEIFEMLMAMDMASLEGRLENKNDKETRFILGQQRSVGYKAPYRVWVQSASRAEECGEELFDHIWDAVNAHLGTRADSMVELVEQLGIMRFGHRPRVADTFCGSGQIPFEGARLGCDVYASDLNPVACMLTWGAFNIVGGSEASREKLAKDQQALVCQVQAAIDKLGGETDGKGWRAKVFLYCVETRCPQSGWMVPLIPSFVISRPRTGEKINVIAKLVPDAKAKRYDVVICSGVSEEELTLAEKGTVRTDGRGQDPYLIHAIDGTEYRTKISTLRGDYRRDDSTNGNRLRMWEKHDFKPRPDDIFQERLYCVQWMRPKKKGKGDEYEFRAVTEADLERERAVELFIADHLAEWQEKGVIPDMRIEPGDKTDEPIRTRGWTYWHHLFNPRQLLVAGMVNRHSDARLLFGLTQLVNWNSRLCRWNIASGGGGSVQDTFYNQALNTLFNYGCRGFAICSDLLRTGGRPFPLDSRVKAVTKNHAVADLSECADIFVTDPPYGDAVKYEEILDFFIAWLRKNPPPEFADWVWDSRRSLAIKGEGEDFRRSMVAAYRCMTECMPENGIQVIMFTHQSGSIWADMANIVWASGLQVTAAWYVVTETDSALREGSYVKGTVLLVLRKRLGVQKTTRDDLAWEIQEEVQEQVDALAGLNQKAKGLYRDENVFEDADIQMAGYAAALRVLTRYATIDGRDMTAEAMRPRVKGETTFVDGLITFAVDTANQCLVPQGIPKAHWDRFTGAERFYLKLTDLETKGLKTLDNYQNFAKAFKVRDFRAFMGSQKANEARLNSAVEFGKTEMSEGSEFHQSALRAVLYAMMELVKNVDGNEVLAHLTLNVPDYYSNQTQRELVVELADYLAKKLETLRPEEASAARVLRDLVKNQRLG
jgi:putative DNA methylase